MSVSLGKCLVLYVVVGLLGTAGIVCLAPLAKESIAGRTSGQTAGKNGQVSRIDDVAAYDADSEGDPPHPRWPTQHASEQAASTEACPRMWAVVAVSNAKSYTLSGNLLRRLPAGTLLNVADIRTIRNRQWAVCTFATNVSVAETFAVSDGDIHTVPGSIGRVPRDELALRIEKAQIEASLTAVRASKPAAASQANPFAAEYRKAKAAYDDYWKRVDELIKLRDSSSGNDHVAYSDKLRNMKGEDVQIANRVKDAAKAYKTWKKEHAGTADAAPRMETLQARLRDIDDRLEQMGCSP